MASAKLRFNTVSTVLLAAVLITLSFGAFAASNECADGIDNDFDGTIDYPQDPECLSLHDDSEGPTGRGLFLSISDGLATVKQNGNMTYTIRLQSERDKQKNVDVHLFIPHQTNLISASNGGRRDGDYVVWRNVTVYSGRARELYVNVGVKPRTPVDLLVVAEVTAEGQKDVDTTRVVEGDGHNLHPLKLHVTDGKAYAEPSETLTYRIRVDNTNGGNKTYQLSSNLPTTLEFVSASGSPERRQRVVTWPKAEILAGEIHEYYLVGEIDRGAVENTPLSLRVSTAETFASDTTTVHTGILDSAFAVQVTDGYDSVVVGDVITYAIRVRNRTNQLATEIDVNNALPAHTEFVAASEGGYWTGKNIRWQGLTVSPHGERILQVQARVRSDAPYGHTLRNSVEVRGNTAIDTTRVGNDVVYSGHGPVTRRHAPIILRKTADRSEVQPGDTLNYTIYLKNNTDKPFNRVVVQDRMDAKYMQVLGSPHGTLDGNRLAWSIPVLRPGEEWTVRYSVQISPHVPHGMSMNNVVSVSGEGMETVSLTERVSTGHTGVVSTLPPTGVGVGGIFVALTGLLGVGQTMVSRRRYL